MWLVFQTTPMSLNRSDITAAKISTAARVGIGTRPTTPENATRMISIQMPAKIDAHLLRAPAATLSDVLLTDPPTGVPWKNPEARFATPWPMKSRLVLGRRSARVRRGLGHPGALHQRDRGDGNAPLITPTVRSLRCGNTSGGSPLGIAPTSATVCDVVQIQQGDDDGRDDDGDQRREQRDLGPAEQEHHRQRGHRRRCADADSMPVGWVMTYQAFCAATPPSVGDPSSPASWPEHDVDRDAGEEAEHHRAGDEPDVAAEVQHARRRSSGRRSGSSG